MKTITCIDVETTGLSPKNDYIIQLSLVNVDANTFEEIEHFNSYIIPNGKYEISQAAEEVHGISREYLETHGKYLRDVVKEVFELIEKSDAYLTYNGNSFDFKFLVKDFGEIGYEFPLDRPCFDAYGMECKMTPRDLSTTYKKYTGEDFEDAHDSLNDVRATVKVFSKQLQLLDSQGVTIDDLKTWKENNLLDPEGFIRDAGSGSNEMKLVFACGKYKDSELYDVMSRDPNYISWWAKNVASERTKNIVRDYLKKIRDKDKQN